MKTIFDCVRQNFNQTPADLNFKITTGVGNIQFFIFSDPNAIQQARFITELLLFLGLSAGTLAVYDDVVKVYFTIVLAMIMRGYGPSAAQTRKLKTYPEFDPNEIP